MDNVALFLAVLGAYLAVFLVIGLVVYVLSSLAHMKALKALGYSKAWMAWIPFVRLYAFADVAADNQESVHMFGSISVPAVLYKFWWVVWIVLPFVPFIGSLASTVVLVVFLGNCYVKMYARLEGTTEQEQQVIGYLSCFLPMIS